MKQAGVAPAGSSDRRNRTCLVQPRTERELFLRLRGGDRQARNRLIELHLPLSRMLAARYRSGPERDDDLAQVAALGLVKAVDRFDLEHGSPFRSFAVPTILGELKRHLRDAGWASRVPRGLQDRALSVLRWVEELTAELHRSPSIGELAAVTRLTEEEVVGAIQAGTALSAVSLYGRSPHQDADEAVAPIDTLGSDESSYELVEYRDAIARSLNGLPEREREIVRLRFEAGLTQSEIGARVGISQMHVSRLLRRAIADMRTLTDAA